MILSPVSFFCPGSTLGRHLMGSDEEQVDQSNCAQWQHLQVPRFHTPGSNVGKGSTAAVGDKPRECRLWREAAIRYDSGLAVTERSSARTDETLWRRHGADPTRGC